MFPNARLFVVGVIATIVMVSAADLYLLATRDPYLRVASIPDVQHWLVQQAIADSPDAQQSWRSAQARREAELQRLLVLASLPSADLAALAAAATEEPASVDLTVPGIEPTREEAQPPSTPADAVQTDTLPWADLEAGALAAGTPLKREPAHAEPLKIEPVGREPESVPAERSAEPLVTLAITPAATPVVEERPRERTPRQGAAETDHASVDLAATGSPEENMGAGADGGDPSGITPVNGPVNGDASPEHRAAADQASADLTEEAVSRPLVIPLPPVRAKKFARRRPIRAASAAPPQPALPSAPSPNAIIENRLEAGR